MTELDPTTDFDIDTNNLDDEFRKMSRYIYAYSQAYSNALSRVSVCKQQVAEIKGVLTNELIAASDKKPADKVLDSKVVIHPTYKAAVHAHIEAENDANTLRGGCTALAAKKDMLIQLGANARKEA